MQFQLGVRQNIDFLSMLPKIIQLIMYGICWGGRSLEWQIINDFMVVRRNYVYRTLCE